MRILLYEFISAAGWRQFGWDEPAESMRREGAAMLAALRDDFQQLSGIEIQIVEPPVDPAGQIASAADELNLAWRELERLVRWADWTLVIAPETGGALEQVCRFVESAGGKLLSPSIEFIRIASDKQATMDVLVAGGVRVPGGVLLPGGAPLPRDFNYPAVLKPVDGAGSQDTWFVDGFDARCGNADLIGNRQPRRLESFCRGLPASVAFLCGHGLRVPLVPCSQRLSDDGRFQYLGGTAPLAPSLAKRAIALADRALAVLPAANGYVGVDLILGDSPDGCDDRVIEINPRLTTSYVGSRALCRGNLAEAMLQIANGIARELSWSSDTVEFDSDGSVRVNRSSKVDQFQS